MILNNKKNNKIYYLVDESDYYISLNFANNFLYIVQNNYTCTFSGEYDIDIPYYLYKTLYSLKLDKFNTKFNIILKNKGRFVEYIKLIKCDNNIIELFLDYYFNPNKQILIHGVVNNPLISLPYKYMNTYNDNLNKLLKDLTKRKK